MRAQFNPFLSSSCPILGHFAASITILFGVLGVSAAAEDPKGTCKLASRSTDTVKEKGIVRGIYTLFGLFASWEGEHTVVKETWIYCTTKTDSLQRAGTIIEGGRDFSGSAHAVALPGLGDEPPAGAGVVARFFASQAECSGDPRKPIYTTTAGPPYVVALDGTVAEMPFTRVMGTLAYFLGDQFDAANYDPGSLAAQWAGMECLVPPSMFRDPTLTWTVGALEPEAPIMALMDVNAPDAKTLRADLGPAAAGATVQLLVSGSPHVGNQLLSLNSSIGAQEIVVPIVADYWTEFFLGNEIIPTVVADANGVAEIGFPALDPYFAGPIVEGVPVQFDFVLAAVAMNGDIALATTTFVRLDLRDLSFCANALP